MNIDVASAAYIQAERILRIEVEVRYALGSSDRTTSPALKSACAMCRAGARAPTGTS
jgi:hypothetical protein